MTSRGTMIAGVPVLIAEPTACGSMRRPAVLWMHGFRADALAHAAELERCAAMGFVAIGVDAVEHGARRTGQLDARLRHAAHGALPVMLEIIAETQRELPALIDALVADFGVDRARVSMVGISMGAFLAYRAVGDDGIPLRSVVALLGSPPSTGDAGTQHALRAFRGIKLLSITAQYDVSVPPAPVVALHEALQQALAAHGEDPNACRHHELRGAGHLTTAAQWAEAMTETMAWLSQHGR